MGYQIRLQLLLLLYAVSGSAMSASSPGIDADIANSQTQIFDYDKALRTSQDAIDNQVGNQTFTDVEGNSIKLSDFAGKPLVLSMVYTSCYQICPMTTRHLSKVVDKARDALGENSFSVAAVGFDAPYDNPESMQYFANKQGVSDKDWKFLSLSEADVEKFSRDIGFVYYPSSNGFDHVIQTTIIDRDGKVYRQVYGQVFDTPLLVDPLIELILGRPAQQSNFMADLTRKVKLFCTTYDPVRDGYYFDYSLFLGMIIGGTIILITSFIILRERSNSRKFSRA